MSYKHLDLAKRFLVLIVFACQASAGTSIEFMNFDHRIQLHNQGDHYLESESQKSVSLRNRLIIKTSVDIGAADIVGWHEDIKKAWPAYEGHTFTYSVVELGSAERIPFMVRALGNRTEVSLVQPDILQVGHFSKQSGTPLPNGTASSVTTTGEMPAARIQNGHGVSVAIIDDGFDLSHPDLRRASVGFQYNVSNGDADVSPHYEVDTHGTLVAGVMFSQGDTLTGSIPSAELIAIRQPNTWTSDTLLALHLARLAGADVINCSWHSQWLLEPVRDAIVDMATFGRDGLGLPIVFAAGNQGRQIFPMETEAGIHEAIVVGSTLPSGNRAPFSNFGETVDVYVRSRTLTSTAVGGGYRRFGGTSLSTAIVSGRIALILQHQPEIHLKDIVPLLTTPLSQQYDKN